MAFIKRTYAGKGKIYIGPYGGAGPLAFVGNVSELTFTHEESKVSVPDFTQSGGGEYDSIRRVDAVGLSMTQWDILKPAELARATRGVASAQTTTTPIVSEAHTAYPGGLIVLARIPDHSASITVVDAGTGGYAETTDFIRTPSGIEIVTGGGITAATPVLISYTPLASDNVEALVTSGMRYKLHFAGLNEADSDRPVLLDVHQYKPGVAASLGWIGTEFLSMQTAGDVLKDTSIVGDSLSKFYRVRYASPV